MSNSDHVPTQESGAQRSGGWVSNTPSLRACFVILGVIVGICLGPLLVTYLALPWTEERGQEIVSPDGRYVAQVREYNQGAMDSFHSRVTIKPRSGVFSKIPWYRNEVFSADSLAPWDIALEWQDAQRLEITYHEPARAVRQEAIWRDVTITYQMVPSER